MLNVFYEDGEESSSFSHFESRLLIIKTNPYVLIQRRIFCLGGARVSSALVLLRYLCVVDCESASHFYLCV
jgi:hypothetical protein